MLGDSGGAGAEGSDTSGASGGGWRSRRSLIPLSFQQHHLLQGVFPTNSLPSNLSPQLSRSPSFRPLAHNSSVNPSGRRDVAQDAICRLNMRSSGKEKTKT